MRVYRSTFTFLAFLALSVSCSKKDQEVEPGENCRFLGRSYNWERKNIFSSSVDTYDSQYKQDEQGRLVFLTVLKSNSMKDSTGIFAKTSEEETYEFKYDGDGFLTELKQHGLLQQEGSAKYDFGYGTIRYRKGKIETTKMTTFTYNAGLVQSSKYVGAVVVQGDNQPTQTFPDNLTTIYKYDSQGVIQTATAGGSVTTYKNGIRNSNISSNGSTVIKYNDQGRIVSISSPYDEKFFKYDQKGNQILQEGFQDNKRRFSEESKFDDHINPEHLIPYQYKGIPEGIRVGYVTDNPNNWVEIKYTFMEQAPTIQTNVWTYNSNGLPDTSTLISGTSDDKSIWITKFKYENCN